MRFILTLLLFTTSIFAWKMEADKVTVKSTIATTFNFRQSYDSPPLVFIIANSTGSDSASIRISSVTSSGFTAYIVEPQGSNGRHKNQSNISYIAIEPGSHTLPNGTKIVAGTVTTQKFQSKTLSGTSWESVSLSGFSETPAVLGMIQSANSEEHGTPPAASDPKTSQPWLTVAIDDVSSSGFNIALERSETTDGTISASETIAYLAIDANINGANAYFGDNSASKITFETILANDIDGWSPSPRGKDVSYVNSYDDAPIVVATKNSRVESDGGWLRTGATGTSEPKDHVNLRVDEDKAISNEREHVGESAGVVVFSNPFDAEFIEPSSAKLIINEVMYNETQTGANNDEFIELYVKEAGNIKGYIISDQDTNYYRFPSCQVSSGDYIVLYTGSGTNSCSGKVKQFYQNKSQYLNNDKDDILLIRPAIDAVTTTQASNPKTFNGEPQDYIAYGSSGGAIDAIPTSLNGVTLSWDSSKANELDYATDGTSIALTPNADDSDTSACWEFSGSGNASDNGCANYAPTKDTEADPTLTYSKGENNNGAPDMYITKSSIVISDPVNNTTNPKRVPGAIIRYCFIVDNRGSGNADDVKIKDSLTGDNKENLTYKKSGSMIQDSATDCDCQSSNMNENTGSINNSEVTINLGTITGTNELSSSRGCAFIELEIN